MLVISFIIEVNPHVIPNLTTMILDGLDLHRMNRLILSIGGAAGYRDLMGNPVQPRTSFVEKFMFIKTDNINAQEQQSCCQEFNNIACKKEGTIRE